MSDKKNPTNTQKMFTIEQIYIKDASYEAPHTPKVFRDPWKPNVKIDLNIGHDKLEENIYEVVLRVTLTAKQVPAETDKEKEGKVLFVAEVKQAGIFSFKGLSEEELEVWFAVRCPEILFPYAREAISNATRKGGFPDTFLVPVNFEHLYLQHKGKQELLKAEVAGSA